MDPLYSAQDMLRCDLCDTPVPPMYCDLCEVKLCKACVGEHISDLSKEHKVVPFTQQPHQKCHTDKDCEFFCENCELPVCLTCVTSDTHLGHKFTHALQKLHKNKQDLQRDLKELEEEICPKYETIASDVKAEKSNLDTRYVKLITAVDQQGDVWHREITAIVNQCKSDIEEMKTEHLAILNNHADEITHSITELKQIILDLKKIQDSEDFFRAFAYKSRNSKFRRLPPKVISPSFSPHEINTDRLQEMFGSLSPLSINTEHGDTMKSAEAVSPPPVKPLLDEPRLTDSIDTWHLGLRSVSCLIDTTFWISSEDCFLDLYDLQGKLLKSIQTKSGNTPKDITVTQRGDLVYTDTESRTVNIVQYNRVREALKHWEIKPGHVCRSSAGDLLVIMDSDDGCTPSKVVRCSGTAETQTIQFDDLGRPLYSSGYYKYISENRNLDICVADNDAEAVVVVNQSGNLRFRYTGHPFNTKQSFDPVGITTDSQSHILTSDCKNNRIHILDQDGQFLRYIHNCDLRDPWGLCVDTADNLFVAEYESGKVKKIKYT
ncbi:uncharacterized protein LOC125673751 [Ostrea edulis]|uniref:uncharacterized protein LOC125673751 n=1 Tax=Ostrea edulis TaxID=37623 RepID=UPI00209404F4|nr:uncharacterized protein LOC125673751 [Ostrea edulis]